MDSPVRRSSGRGAVAIALWAAAGAVWAVDAAVAASWVIYVFALLLLAALLYTLWYFFRREEACRHCGAVGVEYRGAGAGGT